ncbi:hypothetical protein [Alloactinosynnema sp. L-07]|uniref:hypothetical protein n=1 Tax=Alloactinosynnema sp. L-07 TaxID=1653480 RepID=UPI0012F8F873|nr:hypothetical protein [Alloactinosynnema sp. L-07]
MDIFYVHVHDQQWDKENADPFAPLIVNGYRDGERATLGKVEPDDDDAFAELLGQWTKVLPSHVVIDRSRE